MTDDDKVLRFSSGQTDDPIGKAMREFPDRVETVEKTVSISDRKITTIIRLRPGR